MPKPDDQSTITTAIFNDEDGNVVVHFQREVNFISFPPETAKEFAELLIKYANNPKPPTQTRQ